MNHVKHRHVYKARCNRKETEMSNNKKAKKFGVIFQTKNYRWFKKTKGNRKINPSHVMTIKKSIAAKDLKLPIFVTEDGDIREGHHTFEARKELGLEVYYIITESKDALDMALINSGRKNWGFKDYLNFHCVRNKADYKLFKSKMDQYGTPVIETIGLFFGKAGTTKEMTDSFKNGDLSISSESLKGFDKTLLEIKRINDMINSDGRIKRPIIRAYMMMNKHPKYDFKRLVTALRTKAGKVAMATSAQDFINQFDNVYNSGLINKSKRMDLIQFVREKRYEDNGENVTLN